MERRGPSRSGQGDGEPWPRPRHSLTARPSAGTRDAVGPEPRAAFGEPLGLALVGRRPHRGVVGSLFRPLRRQRDEPADASRALPRRRRGTNSHDPVSRSSAGSSGIGGRRFRKKGPSPSMSTHAIPADGIVARAGADRGMGHDQP
ncbi:MAG: hypothetical protein AVDCRST_MAG49-453 [uncultured Thermomicrobiales bacterium]|uniref:Uncharacterized protein n=1 Tax=uncultured Thermomicrobiales bacterium TaxID=1645740 RepID=A0A6J4U3Z9_9BACT|nr:MAG: hypothetical protein AVDCRST_MAG49-453 [uncultured Thermomicrobiales bacterium]